MDDEKRAYPGEEPVVKRGKDCGDGEDVCLEEPNVAFFLTHALRELQVFVESLEIRFDQLYARKDGKPPAEDPEELLSQVLALNPLTHPKHIDVLSADIPRALRLVRLGFLVPAIQALATVARIAEGPVPHVRDRSVALLDRFIDSMREQIERFVAGRSPGPQNLGADRPAGGQHPGAGCRRSRRHGRLLRAGRIQLRGLAADEPGCRTDAQKPADARRL